MAGDRGASDFVLRIEVVGKAEGDVLNVDIDQMRLLDYPEYDGQPFTDLMSAFRTFVAAHPDLKSVGVKVTPGKK